jgi:uncharacterized metal-binding protein
MVFACSGASDVGGVTDQAARKLSREKTASMSCIAAVAAEIPDIMKKVQAADQIIALDGCDHECAAAILRKGGIDTFAHVRLKELGLEKGKTPVTEETIAKAACAAAEALERQAERMA